MIHALAHALTTRLHVLIVSNIDLVTVCRTSSLLILSTQLTEQPNLFLSPSKQRQRLKKSELWLQPGKVTHWPDPFLFLTEGNHSIYGGSIPGLVMPLLSHCILPQHPNFLYACTSKM